MINWSGQLETFEMGVVCDTPRERLDGRARHLHATKVDGNRLQIRTKESVVGKE